jgi:hypothetical protein
LNKKGIKHKKNETKKPLGKLIAAASAIQGKNKKAELHQSNGKADKFQTHAWPERPPLGLLR